MYNHSHKDTKDISTLFYHVEPHVLVNKHSCVVFPLLDKTAVPPLAEREVEDGGMKGKTVV